MASSNVLPTTQSWEWPVYLRSAGPPMMPRSCRHLGCKVSAASSQRCLKARNVPNPRQIPILLRSSFSDQLKSRHASMYPVGLDNDFKRATGARSLANASGKDIHASEHPFDNASFFLANVCKFVVGFHEQSVELDAAVNGIPDTADEFVDDSFTIVNHLGADTIRRTFHWQWRMAFHRVSIDSATLRWPGISIVTRGRTNSNPAVHESLVRFTPL
ncbi:hypothetical protein KC325_g84 [Hortaea werneckii]|nr:hypothetical protein KC325_g84 [Hortaea werneckii]